MAAGTRCTVVRRDSPDGRNAEVLFRPIHAGMTNSGSQEKTWRKQSTII
jgi:hypothetical protein